MTTISAVTPSGEVQLGNYLGAIRHWARHAQPTDRYFVSDLHAMTTTHNPATLHGKTLRTHAILLAAGLAPEQVFVQSDLLAEHAALTWVLECVCTFGEARRMTQFKQKSRGQDGVRLGLLTYPVLMAADILLHGAQEIPVGDDQRQHVELARALAKRFNNEYGDVFIVPRAVVPKFGARIMDLVAPHRKMAKSSQDCAGVVGVLDPPELITRKILRATTDAEGVVRYTPERQPGVSNLLDILAAATERDPRDITAANYAALKKETAEAVVEMLRPVRERALALLAAPEELATLRAKAAIAARESAAPRLAAATRLVGIGPRV